MNLFLTVFLGLVVGPATVELQPPAEVDAVHIILDGERVAEISDPPWRAEVDFGDELLPHRLEVEAVDADGRVLGRDRQWVNLPVGPAHAGIELVDDPRRGRGLRLRWVHVLGYEPSHVRLHVDQQPVPVNDPSWVALPQEQFGDGGADLTLVRLEVEFADFSVAGADVVLRGGELIREDVELTSVPVERRQGDAVGRPLGGIEIDSRQPELLALERGPAQIVMVVDPAVLDRFGARLDQAALERRESRAGQGIEFTEGVTVLEDDDWVKFVWPVPVRSHPTSEATQIFDYSRDLTRADGDLVEILRRTTPPMPSTRSDVRLADSVAVAGLIAASRSRRRAVILVTDAEVGSARSAVGRFTPRAVTKFLGRLRVPLLVWTTGEDRNLPWGEARRLTNPRSVERAIAELRRIVDRQRIAWVRGLHLPQEIEVSGRREIGGGI